MHRVQPGLHRDDRAASVGDVPDEPGGRARGRVGRRHADSRTRIAPRARRRGRPGGAGGGAGGGAARARGHALGARGGGGRPGEPRGADSHASRVHVRADLLRGALPGAGGDAAVRGRGHRRARGRLPSGRRRPRHRSQAQGREHSRGHPRVLDVGRARGARLSRFARGVHRGRWQLAVGGGGRTPCRRRQASDVDHRRRGVRRPHHDLQHARRPPPLSGRRRSACCRCARRGR